MYIHSILYTGMSIACFYLYIFVICGDFMLHFERLRLKYQIIIRIMTTVPFFGIKDNNSINKWKIVYSVRNYLFIRI